MKNLDSLECSRCFKPIEDWHSVDQVYHDWETGKKHVICGDCAIRIELAIIEPVTLKNRPTVGVFIHRKTLHTAGFCNKCMKEDATEMFKS